MNEEPYGYEHHEFNEDAASSEDDGGGSDDDHLEEIDSDCKVYI